MKHPFILGALSAVAIMELAACQSLIPTQVQLPVLTAINAAEAATDGANHIAAVAAPHLTPAQAHNVKTLVDVANSETGNARAAYKQGKTGDAIGLVTTALKAAGDVTVAVKQ